MVIGKSSPKKIGRMITITVLAYTAVASILVLYRADFNPRTDDAEVFANYIGIAPQVDGPIMKLYVKDNQFVKKGELLAEIDPRPYTYALEQVTSDRDALEGQITDQRRVIAAETSGVSVSQAGVSSAEANVGGRAANIGEARAAVSQGEAGLTRAQADLAYAASNLHRIEPLLAEKFVTVDQVDQARTLVETKRQAVEEARAQLEHARAALQSAQAQYEQSKADLEQSRAQVQESVHNVRTLTPLTSQRPGKMSAIETAQYNLNNCRIYAPFDARVTNLTISEGAYARIGQQIFTLIDTRTWWVIGNYRETQLRNIRAGMPTDIYLPSHPNKPLRGTVESIGYGVTPDPDIIGKFDTQLPDLQRTLNWVHLASRFPVRIRINSPQSDAFRMGETAVAIVHNPKSSAGR